MRKTHTDTCPKCKGPVRPQKSNPFYYCPKCAKAKNDSRKEDRRWYWITKKYGVTKEAYEHQLRIQDGKCAICRLELVESASTHVDHDHTTGKLRALLCSGCNHGLGKFRDSPELLRRAADYVEHFRKMT